MKKQELDFMRFIEDKYSNFLVSDESKEPVEVISTGSIALDVSTGIGGIPRGKFSVIWGLESTGKTTLSLSIAKQAYKRELKTLFEFFFLSFPNMKFSLHFLFFFSSTFL